MSTKSGEVDLIHVLRMDTVAGARKLASVHLPCTYRAPKISIRYTKKLAPKIATYVLQNF